MLRAVPLAEDYCKKTIRHLAGEPLWHLLWRSPPRRRADLDRPARGRPVLCPR